MIRPSFCRTLKALVLALAAAASIAARARADGDGDGAGLPVPTDPDGSRSVGLRGGLLGETGSRLGRAPRSLPTELAGVDERAQLGPDRHGAIVPVADSPSALHPEREPLVLVHGIRGSPSDLEPIVRRFRDSPKFQIHAFCYESWERRTSRAGVDLAEELRRLACGRARGPITIVGHSMGGIVVRRALNELAFGPGRGIDLFTRVRFVTVDSPWAGYAGPSDRGADAFFMSIASAFMPAALVDMRARSAMFQGDPRSTNPAERSGLCDRLLPDSVSIDMVFAESGNEVHDYSEAELIPISQKLADWFNHETPVRGDPRIVNFKKALISADAWLPFEDAMEAQAPRLDAACVRRGLERFYPKFPGDHMGVLQEHPGRASFLDHLARLVAR